MSGRERLWRDHLGGLAAFLVALGLTSGSLWALHTWAPATGRWVEVVVLVVANAAATLLRFLTLRGLMGHRARTGSGEEAAAEVASSTSAAGPRP